MVIHCKSSLPNWVDLNLINAKLFDEFPVGKNKSQVQILMVSDSQFQKWHQKEGWPEYFMKWIASWSGITNK